MPRKIRELKQMLRKAGWLQVIGGKGSHSKWKHEKVARTLILSGNEGADAKPPQEKDVQNAIAEAEAPERGSR